MGRLHLLTQLAVALSIAAAAAACGQEEGRGDRALRVVATTSHLADLVRSVAPGAEVHQIVPADADPHGYEPRPSDARAVAEADLVLRSGGEVDEWLDDVIEGAGGADPLTVGDARGVNGGDDPHWWQDPDRARAAVFAIGETLHRLDPAEGYRQTAARHMRRLARLDRSVRECIDQIPPRQRTLVTTHDALGLYAQRYGLRVVGALIPSRSTQAQPSSKDTEELVRQIERLDVRAIFPESSVDPELERAVARETGAEVGEALWVDSLGPEGSRGATYLEAIASNTAAIVDGLTGGRVRCRPRA